MLPEEKVACRFSLRRSLRPPVDVESLVCESAELEEDALPSDFDAVFLDRSAKHPRPRVIVALDQPPARRVFTLAHELGHIVIPWHNGTHFCHVDGEARLVDDLTREVETQANRFAAELLMPAVWVKGLISQSGRNLSELFEAIRSAKVSYHAASIRLVQLLPIGFLFVETDTSEVVVRSSASPKTMIQLPQVGSTLQRVDIDSLAEETASFKSGSSKLIWWRLSSKITRPKATCEGESSSELLWRILTEAYCDNEEAEKAMMTINGVIGAANGTNLRNESMDLFTVLKQRLLARKGIAKLVAHKSFDEFLAKRAEELRLRHQS
jgi:hypothetical protein